MKTTALPNNLAVVNKLTQANYVIDKFINSCSHSMRGPLKTIRGLVNLMSETSTDHKPDPMLGLIQRTATHLEDILNQLEQFLENSKKEMKIEEVQIESVIGEVEARFQADMQSRAMEITVDIGLEDKIILTDRELFKTILTQLFSNAIAFSDPGKSKKMIAITGKAFHRSYHLTISDNGIGIQPENVSRIFQLFYRGSEQSKGAGIGLYIVKEVVEKLKGMISVQSQPGSGTKFLVWLPHLN